MRARLFLILGTLAILVSMLSGLRGPAPARAAPAVAAGSPAVQSKVTLGEMSVDGPALWTAPAGSVRAVLAWTGTDSQHHLNVERSTSNGLTYTDKRILNELSATRPAVAHMSDAAGGAVALAWTGTDARHSLNVLFDVYGAHPQKLVLSTENSFTSPALTVFNGNLLLAWAGTDPGHSLNVLPILLSGGAHAGKKTILGAFHSGLPPSLALNPGNTQLLLSWAATSPAQQLTFATSSNGTSWSAAQAVGNETSIGGPSGFAVAASGLPPYWMAWTGADAAHSLNVRVTPSFPSWPLSGNKTTLQETALGGPALGYVGTSGRMLLGWTGTDAAHHLNLATITTASLDQRIDAYIARLSTAQRIGQTLMLSVYAPSDTTALNQALAQWHLGSAIFFPNYNGGAFQPATISGVQALTRGLQSHANLPLLIATDQEGGTVDRLAHYYGGTPSARQLAATGNPQNAYTQAQTDAARMRSLGLNLDFAPVVDVDQGGGIGSSRTFGTSVSTVTTYAGAFLDGLQQHGVAGTLKHWPGLGAATGNPDLTLPTINRTQAQMSATDFAPFRNLLARQPGMIMTTTVLAPAYDSKNPAMLSPTLVSTVLRGQLGYQGVIVTDSLDAQGLITYMRQQGFSNTAQGLAEASVRAFLAGNDLIELPIESDRLAAVAAAMTQAVQSGRISSARLNASVHRIIALKVRLGLLTV